ncbi:hypothetical protein OH76DRAFT_1057324 [Lentinus brumalis]|uniref:Uncharacterized protein n=1 Tax=Lentinus brumalis TaxID=2498619 RepID=A0A371DN94_9APHY|nr:hypothetical protein OH76DRAFT_1057324 [Polyporus brumalis]
MIVSERLGYLIPSSNDLVCSLRLFRGSQDVEGREMLGIGVPDHRLSCLCLSQVGTAGKLDQSSVEQTLSASSSHIATFAPIPTYELIRCPPLKQYRLPTTGASSLSDVSILYCRPHTSTSHCLSPCSCSFRNPSWGWIAKWRTFGPLCGVRRHSCYSKPCHSLGYV